MTQTVKKVLPNLKYLQDVHSHLDRLPHNNYFSMSQKPLFRPKGTLISGLITHYCQERLSISPSAWYKATQGNNLFWLVLESVVHVSRESKMAGVWGFLFISGRCGNHRNNIVGCRSGLKPSWAILNHTFYPARPHLKVSWPHITTAPSEDQWFIYKNLLKYFTC